MIVKKINQLKKIISSQPNKKIYFVPTMGNLHDGHLSLLEYAQKKKQFLIVSIFVNPLQFDSRKDFTKYPRTIKNDLKILKQFNIDTIFLPENNFSKENLSTVNIESLTNKLCGADRPGHFVGVATIILKFLNLIQPDFLMLGQKDYQQILVIRQIIKDFFFKTKIIELPIIRNNNGLALSSRNILIPYKKKELTKNIFLTLKLISDEIKNTGLKKTKIELYKKKLLMSGIEKINYLEILNESDLSNVAENPCFARIFISVTISGIKLIDNIRISKRVVL
ncbi:MAG: pantoate--beta-alanine ligase, partial [Alphaproteobacteria bacterium]